MSDGKNELLERVRDVVNQYRTWIRAEDDFLLRVIYIDVGYGMVPYPCDNLILTSLRKTSFCREGHEWYIPEFQLRDAMSRLFPSAGIDGLGRWQVEALILDITNGSLKLNLWDERGVISI